MILDHFRGYCLKFKSTLEDLSFDENTLVFVMVKMFALTNLLNFEFVKSEYDPENSIEFRERFIEITPVYPMNKKHWNSVRVDSKITRNQLEGLISDSYSLAVAKLYRKLKAEL